MFMLIQFAMKQFMPQQQASTVPTSGGAAVPSINTGPIPAYSDRPSQFSEGATYNAIPQGIAPMWATDTSLDLSIYVSPSMVLPTLNSLPKSGLVLEEKNFKLGNYSDKRDISATFLVPKETQNNGTLWAHFLVAHTGSALDPSAHNYDTSKAYHFTRPLTQYLPKKKVAKKHNLLSSGANDTAPTPDDQPKTTLASYYHPNFTLSFIPDSGVANYPSMHPAVRSFIQLERSGSRDASGQNGWYYPILFLNTFWQLRSHMTELNSTVTELPIHIHLNNMANWKFSVLASLDDGMKTNAQKIARGESVPGGGDGSEFEMFKEILLDSNIYLLSITGVVSVLHIFFEMLAFKNDVSHWRKKKDNVGTSVRTIVANVFMQLIIFLYLLDNNDNTSWMILFGQGMGIAIEAWKITKTANVRIRPTPANSRWPLPYFIALEDKHQLSETEQKTEEYDKIAFKYMYLLAIPLLAAYAVYSVIYDEHKSWYSFTITTLVGSVYAYGFLMMIPSLYINYRLKSVAHMPAKAMTYKFLNTFIDDLFAFTIKMPLLHRLATLRDDVIFFVYIYQKWVYKVDYTRVNEFGQGGDDDEVEEETTKGKVAAAEDIKKVEAKAGAKAKASGVEAKEKVTKRK
jgi:hypothetical protein